MQWRCSVASYPIQPHLEAVRQLLVQVDTAGDAVEVVAEKDTVLAVVRTGYVVTGLVVAARCRYVNGTYVRILEKMSLFVMALNLDNVISSSQRQEASPCIPYIVASTDESPFLAARCLPEGRETYEL